MTNEMASEILIKEYKCCTEPCPSPTIGCHGCIYDKTNEERNIALMMGARALKSKSKKKEIIDWLPSALEAIRSGVADKLSKDGVTAYRVKNIIRIDIKEE